MKADIPRNLYPTAAAQLSTTASDVPATRVRVLNELVRDLSSGRPSLAGAQRILATLLWLSAANAVLSRYQGRRPTRPGGSAWDGHLGNCHPSILKLSNIHDTINGLKLTDYNIENVTKCALRHIDSLVPDCQVRVDTALTADITSSEFVAVRSHHDVIRRRRSPARR